jgi:hypothetical protein
MPPTAEIPQENHREPTSGVANPASRFATFFRGYGIALGLVMAAVPIATKAANLLPIFATTKDVLTFSTSLASFLAIAILFGARRSIGEAVFPRTTHRCIPSAQFSRRKLYGTIIPTCFVIVAIAALAGYLVAVHCSLTALKEKSSDAPRTIEIILKETTFIDIPNKAALDLTYGVMFVFATMAFVWLGLIEYIQSDLRLTDSDLITNPYRQMSRLRFKLRGVEDDGSSSTYFTAEYDPDDEKPKPLVRGPYCLNHDRPLGYAGKEKGTHTWVCADAEGKNAHDIVFRYDSVESDEAAKKMAEHVVQAALKSKS